ncbi:MAG: hypothetical protein V4654_12240 [Bdellovibrionota bacterium]
MKVLIKVIVVFLFNIHFAFAGSSVSINGKTYSCNGSLSVINGKAICNGKNISATDDISGPCGAAKTRPANLGTGQIDVRAKVSNLARIDGVVCGGADIGDSVIIQKGATINGAIKVERMATVKSGATLNGSGVVGEGVTIGERATLNGRINIKNSSIAKDTVLSGNINIDGVNFTGDVTCSGNGTISNSGSKSPPAQNKAAR